MKQLTVLCSEDLSGQVYEVLVRNGVDGFLKIPHAVGYRPGAAAQHGRHPHWEAEMFLATVATGDLDRVVDALREFAGHCDTDPCLKILVAPLEAVY